MNTRAFAAYAGLLALTFAPLLNFTLWRLNTP